MIEQLLKCIEALELLRAQMIVEGLYHTTTVDNVLNELYWLHKNLTKYE